MKALKIIGIIILVLVLIVVILALIAPKKYEVSRSIVINAEKELVFRQMQYWRNWGVWSPWAAQDSTMTITVTGIDGQVDSKYIWEGDPEITGSGDMTNTGVIPGEEMTYHLFFKTPWESHSDGWVRVKEVDSGTEASWGFYGKYPIPMNIMLLFMPMDKMIGPDFEHGMQLLKKVVEAKASKLVTLEVKEMEFKSTTYAAIRDNVPMSDIKSFYENSYAQIGNAIGESGASMVGMPVGIFYEWNEDTGVADMAAGIPIRGKVESDNVRTVNVEGSNALYIDFYGPYEETELAHLAMMNHLQKNNVPFSGLIIEQYVTDPGSEPDPNNWLTKVIYLTE